KDCGWQPVSEKDLPVVLPDIKDFKPKGDGASPLHNAPVSWKKVACPNCGKEAERELDVSDTFLDSAWYFLRYPSVNFEKGPWNPNITKKWFPVDAYIGGAEHAVLHLLYARFVWMMLLDNGFLPKELGNEPFPFLYGHGLIIKDGAKMSKSRGNVVVPDEYIEKYGADTLRCYLMFLGPYDQGGDFRDTGIEGMNRFMKRVWKIYESYPDVVLKSKEDSSEVLFKMHRTIKKVTEDIEGFRYNTAIAAIMKFVNTLYEKIAKEGGKKARGGMRCAEWDEALRTLCLLLAPVAPFMTEEIWQKFYGRESSSVHANPWPTYKEELLKTTEVVVIVQINGKLRSQLIFNIAKATSEEEAKKSALSDPKVGKWLKGKKIKKIIFVSGKLINFVL
ncbi:class I tRNA ligase family protein, partial [Candidatus Woesebacteria bacterium]|nr:class I tRNA ligase family protein [Candidatus Woesebacteria bacterium]